MGEKCRGYLGGLRAWPALMISMKGLFEREILNHNKLHIHPGDNFHTMELHL